VESGFECKEVPGSPKRSDGTLIGILSVSVFGLWALGFGLWALGFGLWALGFGLRASGLGSYIGMMRCGLLW
jgi:hypothetical protein